MPDPETRQDAPPAPVRTKRVRPGCWRVSFHNPPFTLYDPQAVAALAAAVDQFEADTDAKVVVFDSALPAFFMAHLDLGRISEFEERMPAWLDSIRSSRPQMSSSREARKRQCQCRGLRKLTGVGWRLVVVTGC